MEAESPQCFPKESFAFYDAIGDGSLLSSGERTRSRYLN